MQEGFFFTFTMTMNSKEILYISPKMHLSNCKSVFDSFILHHWMSIREFFALKINLLSPFSLLFGVHWTVTINKNAFRLEEPRKIDFFFCTMSVCRVVPRRWKNRTEKVEKSIHCIVVWPIQSILCDRNKKRHGTTLKSWMVGLL